MFFRAGLASFGQLLPFLCISLLSSRVSIIGFLPLEKMRMDFGPLWSIHIDLLADRNLHVFRSCICN